jgi:hypothetical protein
MERQASRAYSVTSRNMLHSTNMRKIIPSLILVSIVSLRVEAQGRAPAIVPGTTEAYTEGRPQWMDCSPFGDSIAEELGHKATTKDRESKDIPEKVEKNLGVFRYASQVFNKKNGEITVYFVDGRKHVGTDGKVYGEPPAEYKHYFISDSAPVYAIKVKADAGPYIFKTDQGDVRIGKDQDPKVTAALNKEVADAGKKFGVKTKKQKEFAREIDLRGDREDTIEKLTYTDYKKRYAQKLASDPKYKGEDEENFRLAQIQESCVVYLNELKKNPAMTPEMYFTKNSGDHFLTDSQCKISGAKKKGC